MPSWSQLDEAELRAVARYVRHLGVEALTSRFASRVAAGELTAEEAELQLDARTTPGPAIVVPPPPPESTDGDND